MAKLRIYTFPDQVLAQKAKPIHRIEKSHQKLAEDMLETMYEAPGVGLAANQVGILERALVMDTEYDIKDLAEENLTEEEKQLIQPGEIGGGVVLLNKKPIIIFNPEIIYKEGEILFKEACLSVPEYSAEVQRAEKIKIKYQDIDGTEKTLSAEGLQAICIQHEMDHLEGKLFIERLSPVKRDTAKRKLLKQREEREREMEEFGQSSSAHNREEELLLARLKKKI